MQAYETHVHIGPDGVLRLELPVAESETDCDVVVLRRPCRPAARLADMKYLLDTNACIQYLNGTSETLGLNGDSHSLFGHA